MSWRHVQILVNISNKDFFLITTLFCKLIIKWLQTANEHFSWYTDNYTNKLRRRQWQPTPVLLPGKSHGWRSLVGYSEWAHEESDMTEWLHFHCSLSCIGEGNGNPLQYSCLENPRDRGAWWTAVYGVAQGRTQLKWLSSSSNIQINIQVSQLWAQNPSLVLTRKTYWLSCLGEALCQALTIHKNPCLLLKSLYPCWGSGIQSLFH